MPDYRTQKTGPLKDIKGIYFAWWRGSRGTMWFWIVPVFVVFIAVTTLFGPVSGWFR